MTDLAELLNISFPSLLLSLFIVLTGIQAIAAPLEWAIGKLGLETKWMRKRQADHALLIQTSKNLGALQEAHKKDMEKSDSHDKEMKDHIQKLMEMFLDKEIDDLRWEILNFASSLSSGRQYNRESFDHIMKIYYKYEKILGENQMENGLVQESMKYITEKYHETLENGI